MGTLLKDSCERRLDAASESAAVPFCTLITLSGRESTSQALSLTQLNGTLLKDRCERRLDAASESAAVPFCSLITLSGRESTSQALSLTQLNGTLLKDSCERRLDAASESAAVPFCTLITLSGRESTSQALSLTQLNGTPFIIIIFAIIFVCVAIAVLVAALMRANNELGGEETEQVDAPGAPADDPHGMTGHLPPFMPLPHQTQPLSEIYYYNEQAPTPQPYVPLAPSNTSSPPVPLNQSDPLAQPAQAEAPPMPPAGPGYQQPDQ